MLHTAIVGVLACVCSAQPGTNHDGSGGGRWPKETGAAGSSRDGTSAQPHAQGAAAASGAPLDWKALEAPLLTEHVQLTTRDKFVKAGEAYFDHNSPPRWVVFQAVPVPEKGTEPDGFYGMYVAKLKYDGGKIVGIEKAVKISPEGSANTCGWFHPTEAGRVIFGSTLKKPEAKERPGFQVGTNRYVWQFPPEMEIVTVRVPEIMRDYPETRKLGDELQKIWEKKQAQDRSPTDMRERLNWEEMQSRAALRNENGQMAAGQVFVQEVFSRPNYDAECSYTKDGRFILYSHVRDEATRGKDDADIWIWDTKEGKQHEIVKADGYDGGPFFSPDGKRICYRSDREGNDKLQLFVADLKFDDDGVPVGIEREHQVTANEHVNWAPFWHPSGKFLIYGTSAMGHSNYEVFAVEAPEVGGDISPSKLRQRRITYAHGADVLPVFSDDGGWMMWTAQRGAMAEGESKPSSQVWVARTTPVFQSSNSMREQILSLSRPDAEKRMRTLLTEFAEQQAQRFRQAGGQPGQPDLDNLKVERTSYGWRVHVSMWRTVGAANTAHMLNDGRWFVFAEGGNQVVPNQTGAGMSDSDFPRYAPVVSEP